MSNVKSKRANAQRLDDYQKQHKPGNRRGRWIDTLPDDIRSEIMASDAGARVITGWLLGLGFDGATESKVEALLIERRKLVDG